MNKQKMSDKDHVPWYILLSIKTDKTRDNYRVHDSRYGTTHTHKYINNIYVYIETHTHTYKHITYLITYN